MRRTAATLSLLAAITLLGGCHLPARPSNVLPPLAAEGDVHVYLQPFPESAPRLGLTFTAVSAVRGDGTEVPLTLALSEISPAVATAQHLLASGRVPEGEYEGLAIQLSRATLATEDGVADLLVPKEPLRVPVRLDLTRRRALVVQVRLRSGQASAGGFDFAGVFAAVALQPEAGLVQSSAYASTPRLASLTVFDRSARQVTAAIPTGREPRGLAVDGLALRAYVALAAEDQIQILDLATGAEVGRVPLSAGDEPTEVALTPDGKLLLVTNRRSNTLAFVDPITQAVVTRIQTGDEPEALLLGPGGRRAYVLDRRSNDLMAVDVGNRAAVSRVSTDPEPLRAQLSRAGDRLYVVHRGSAYLTVYSVPELAQVSRIYVGLGATAVEVDPRTGFVYVAQGDTDRLQVFDPGSLLPVDEVDLPGPAAWLGLDPIQNVLMAAVPSRGAVALVDLTRRKLVAQVELGAGPYAIVVPGGRP